MKLDWLGQNATWKTYIGHLKYWAMKTEEANIMIDENDRRHDLIWFNAYIVNLKSLNITTLPLQSQINIYSDGSKTDQHAGSGFVGHPGNELADKMAREAAQLIENTRHIPPIQSFQARIVESNVHSLEI